MFEQTDFYNDVPRERVYRSLKRAVLEESAFVHADKSAISLNEQQVEATLNASVAAAGTAAAAANVVFNNDDDERDEEDEEFGDRLVDEEAPTFGAATFVAS